jgi:hypothetical protein
VRVAGHEPDYGPPPRLGEHDVTGVEVES